MTCKANQYCVTCQGLGKPSDTVQIWIGERGGTEEGGLGVRGGGVRKNGISRKGRREEKRKGGLSRRNKELVEQLLINLPSIHKEL